MAFPRLKTRLPFCNCLIMQNNPPKKPKYTVVGVRVSDAWCCKQLTGSMKQCFGNLVWKNLTTRPLELTLSLLICKHEKRGDFNHSIRQGRRRSRAEAVVSALVESTAVGGSRSSCHFSSPFLVLQRAMACCARTS